MAKQDFINGLQDLGYQVEDRDGKLVFDYKIDVGIHAGKTIKLGLTVANDFPLQPPDGPRVSPRLYPIYPKNDQPHPLGAVHEANEYEANKGETNWEYWSRPLQTWGKSDRSVKTYMKHIRELFGKIDS